MQRPWGGGGAEGFLQGSAYAEALGELLQREGCVRASSGRHPGPRASALLTTLSPRKEGRQHSRFNY